jgi:hypothetical protein
MNHGPLEFAAHLRRREAKQPESAAVQAARAAAPVMRPEARRLTIVAGAQSLSQIARNARIDAVSVYEAVAMSASVARTVPESVQVRVKPMLRPLVLVLSSHQAVHWQLALAPGTDLCAVLLAGGGESRVSGAGETPISSIGGFYAFKRGSEEFQHLEREVMRCIGRNIENFHSAYATQSFEIGSV